MSTCHSLVPEPLFDETEAISGTRRCAVPVMALAPRALPAGASRVSSSDLQSYMHLVRATVGGMLRRLPRSVQRDDLLAAGMFGLMDALSKHTEERGPAFEWYARTRIRGAILDELRKEDWLSRGARARATEAGESAPRPAIVGIEELDGPHALDADRPESALDSAVRRCERLALWDAVARLPPRERSIIEMHYVHEIPYKDIGDTLGVSVPRISQLHARAVGLLRQLIEASEERTGPSAA